MSQDPEVIGQYSVEQVMGLIGGRTDQLLEINAATARKGHPSLYLCSTITRACEVADRFATKYAGEIVDRPNRREFHFDAMAKGVVRFILLGEERGFDSKHTHFGD